MILYLKMTFLRSAILIILVLIPFLCFAQEEPSQDEKQDTEQDIIEEQDIDELRYRILGEAPNELMRYKLWDSSVSLFMTGFWKGELQGNAGFSSSPVGIQFAAPESPFLFKQEVDLTMSLWINNKWFVEANFLDDSAKNTYRAGYKGTQSDFLKYVGIGNAGLDFPVFPYLDLGGDSPSSFGIYSRFGTDDLNIHALFRYDAASREERIFTGTRERTYSDLQPHDTIRGVSFVLPDDGIDNDITVYIEDEKGSLRDDKGRRWRYALQSEFAVSFSRGLLELAIRPQGMVAVVYTKNGDRPWINSMGNYDTSIPGSTVGYLTIVQNWFDSARSKIKLEDYIQCGSDPAFPQRPGEVTFGVTNALVIYQSGAFSPFERRNRYDAPSSSTQRASLVDISSSLEIKGFELTLLDEFAITDAFTFSAVVTHRGAYELFISGSIDKRSPETLWPLASDLNNYIGEGEIYLPGKNINRSSVILRFTNFSSVSGFFIGTDAISGSIQVFRSGIQDTDFRYNAGSGEVIINGSVGENEIIRITYLKKDRGLQPGSIAAGIGAIYRGSGGKSPFSAQAALGLRWNLTEESYTEHDLSNTGSVGISAKAAWDYDRLKARVTGGFSFNQTDTTGLYRAAGMEGNELIHILPSELSFISNPPSSLLTPDLEIMDRSDLIYRNYNNSGVLGNSLLNIDSSAAVVQGINRPYSAKDPNLGNAQVLVMEFNMQQDEWTGFQLPLDQNYSVLSLAQEIEVPFRFYNFNKTSVSNFKLIVQIGSLSPKDTAFSENTDFIWEQLLFSDEWELNPPDNPDADYTSVIFNNNERIARFSLSDRDRQKLSDARQLRVFAYYTDTSAENLSGRILFAPVIVRGASFRAVTYDGNQVNAASDFSSGAGRVKAIETMETVNTLSSAYSEIIRKLHPELSAQRVLKIEWENMDNDFWAGVDGRVGELPLSDYRVLSFFVKGPLQHIEGSLNFIIAKGSQDFYNRQLEAKIPLTQFTSGKWSKVEIRYQGDKKIIKVDGIETGELKYNPLIKINDTGVNRFSYMALFISPDPAVPALADGTIFIDEIILEDPVLFYRANAGAGFEYSKPGQIVSAGKVSVLSDFSFNTALESEARIEEETENSDFSASMVSRSAAEISVFGAKVKGNFAFTAAKDTFLWNADHSISKSIGAFSINESFSASAQNNFARHNFNISFMSDFHAKFDADALYDFSKLRQKWLISTGYKPKNDKIPMIAINSEALWIGKEEIDNDAHYWQLWGNSWEPLLPDTGIAAESRKTRTQFTVTQRTKPVGAVLKLEGNTNFTEINNITRSDYSAFIDVPVTLEKTSLNFRAGRSFKKHLYYSSFDALDDGKMFFQSVEDSLSFWKVFPFYSIFAQELNNAMDESLINMPLQENAFYSYFSDYFSVRAALPRFYNLTSFFVPSRVTLILERVLEQKMDTRNDKLNIGTLLQFQSVNIFGAMSAFPVFKFYQTDEYSHSFEYALVIPKGENPTWRINSVLSAGFRGFSGSMLNFVNNLNIRSEGYWTESLTALWEVPVKKSYLSVFYNWVSNSVSKGESWAGLSNILNSRYEILRRESLELVFDNSKDYLRWSIIAGHEDIIRIIGRLNFTTFIKLRCSEDKEYKNFIFDVMLGTTLRISF